MRGVASHDSAVQKTDLRASGQSRLFDEGRIPAVEVILGGDGVVVDDAAVLRDPDGLPEKIGGGVGQVHDDVIGKALVLLRHLPGVPLQDHYIIDPVEGRVLPHQPDGIGVLIHGDDPRPPLRDQKGEGAHPREHVEDDVAGSDELSHPQPLRSEARGEVGLLQIDPILDRKSVV